MSRMLSRCNMSRRCPLSVLWSGLITFRILRYEHHGSEKDMVLSSTLIDMTKLDKEVNINGRQRPATGGAKDSIKQ